MGVQYDPFATLASVKLRAPILAVLADMGDCSLEQIAFLLGEDQGIVAGTLKRLDDEGLVDLDRIARRVQLPKE